MLSVDETKLNDLCYVSKFLEDNLGNVKSSLLSLNYSEELLSKKVSADELERIKVLTRVQRIKDAFMTHGFEHYHKFDPSYNVVYCLGPEMIEYIRRPKNCWTEGKLPLPNLYERVKSMISMKEIKERVSGHEIIYIELFHNELKIYSGIRTKANPPTMELKQLSLVKGWEPENVVKTETVIYALEPMVFPHLEIIPQGIRIHFHNTSKLTREQFEMGFIDTPLSPNSEINKFYAWLSQQPNNIKPYPTSKMNCIEYWSKVYADEACINVKDW
ncbi:hypothetical protein [Carp edema virus]|nr:hypothetical protein [Carp edema virus]